MARYISIFLTTKYLSSDWFLGCRSIVALFANVKTIKVFLKTFSKRLVASVNFINVFMRSFYAHRSQKHKKLLDLTVFFALLESLLVKAVRIMLVKLTLGVDFINILQTAFECRFPFTNNLQTQTVST